MSDYSLVQRGQIAATSADGAGPKDFTISAVKTASTFVTARVRDRRQNAFVQRGTVTWGDGTTSPQNVTLGTAIDLACTTCHVTFRENRDGNARGVAAELTSTTNLQLRFYGTIDAGENIEVSWEVIERKPRRMATVRLLNTTTVRMEWDGTLAAGETIEASFDVFDLENFGDDIKEILFRLQRILGDNMLQDSILLDNAGNMTQFRLRFFDSQANAAAATPDFTGGLQTGETARVTLTQDINVATNDRKSLLKVRTDVIATPGVN